MNTVLERKEEGMKFVISGRTFDTATSTPLAIARGAFVPDQFEQDHPGAAQVRYEHVLYRTAKGALFLHCHDTAKYKSGKPVVDDSAAEHTPEEAAEWIQNSGAMVMDAEGLPLPPEA